MNHSDRKRAAPIPFFPIFPLCYFIHVNPSAAGITRRGDP